MNTLQKITKKHREDIGIGRNEIIEGYINKSIDWIEKRTKIKSYVLDIGCNYGYALFNYSQKNIKGIGIDIYPQRIFKNIEILKYDFEKLKYIQLKENINLIFLNHTLEHSTNPIKLLKECFKILESNGSIFIAVPSPISKHYIMPGHFSIFTIKFLKHILKNIGFSNFKFELVEHRKDYQEIYFLAQKI